MKLHYRCCRCLLRGLFRLCFRWRTIGAEQIPAHGAAILAANHASYLDPPLIGSAAFREIFYLARQSLFRFPLIGRFLRSVNALPVDRGGRSPKGLKAILDCLAGGGAVLLFPEGTRTKDGTLQPAQPGIGLVAVKSGAPVIPVRLYGTYEAWNRNTRFPRPRRITLIFGAPLHFDVTIAATQTAPKQKTRQIYAAISQQIMETIAKLDIHNAPTTSRHPKKNHPA